MSGRYKRKRFDWFALIVSILVASLALSLILVLVTYEPAKSTHCPR